MAEFKRQSFNLTILTHEKYSQNMPILPLNKYQELQEICAQLGKDDMIRIVNNGRPNQEQQQPQNPKTPINYRNDEN